MEVDRLREEILDVQNLEKKPSNEAQTREWIIKPLLDTLGYKRNDIEAESPEPNGKIPDYTILNNTEYTWFLEAKDWKISLNDTHADQSLNYAHSKGRRWVVLSNGKEWRLYDDTISGVSSDRLVAEVQIHDTEDIYELLTAINRESIINDEISRYASRQRIKSILNKQLYDHNSELIKAISRVLQKDSFKPINEDIVMYFRCLARKSFKENDSIHSDKESDMKNITTSQLQLNIADKLTTNHNDVWRTLAFIMSDKNYFTSKSPIKIKLPDNDIIDLTTWTQVYIEFFRYAIKLPNFPDPPFGGKHSSSSYFYNTKPYNKDGKPFRKQATFIYKNNTCYYEKNLSTQNILERIIHICKAMNLPLEGFQFKLQE